MTKKKKLLAIATSAVLLCTGVTAAGYQKINTASAADSIEASMEWGTMRIGGGGFVSGIVTGKEVMYARTDVGGAYKYNYETNEWDQLFAFLNDADRGFLSVDSMAIDPTDDNTVYFLCGCAYFSDARTAIFKTTDGGKTFTQIDVTDQIQVHGNGYGRQCGESIAIDPDNPDVLYCGGDVASGDSALIMSKDGGMTWTPVKGYDELGYYRYSVPWPQWVETHQVRAATTNDASAYNMQNGVATIYIEDGKVYVGTDVTDCGANMVVADVGSDDFQPISADLPENSYPCRITSDKAGNLFFTYVGGLAFARSGGGAYKYNIASGTVTNISPDGESSMGEICVDPKDPNKLVANTCGVWSSQLYYEGAWDNDEVAWGDQFYRSNDGGKTWEGVTPGNAKSWGGPLQADYIQVGDFDWIYNKAIHWCGSMVVDPQNSDKVLICSGNGVFNCDNIWDELPVYYFHPNGIEEVVALDMVSIPGGNPYSAIGDYDGFEHPDEKTQIQHKPNMGSTGAIAYCPQNPDVMVRYAENQNDKANGFYTTDGGKNWTKMSCGVGGKAAITQLSEGKYRFFQGNKDDGKVKYSDDWGETWNDCSGINSTYGSKPTYMLVEPDQPNVVYAYATYYNSSWFYSKPQPDFSDAHYTLYVSTDYGATFTGTDIAMYDQCDSAGRIAYLGEDDLILAAGWYGLYRVTGSGKNVESLDVFYCKTVGYGAPEKEGDINTLFMYGKPAESDPEGIYRSQDGGKTWLLINQNYLYGGTGNGNFLVGDMNEFGKVYMSTVGCGIVYGKVTGSQPPKPVQTTTTPAVTTTKPVETTTAAETTVSSVVTEKTTTEAVGTTTPAVTTKNGETTAPVVTTDSTGSTDEIPKDVLYGDVNLDGKVELVDAILLNKACAGQVTLSEEASANADCDANGGVDTSDSVALLRFLVHLEDTLPVKA